MWKKKKGYAARLSRERGKTNRKVEGSVMTAGSLNGMYFP